MKFGEVLEYSKINFFLQKSCRPPDLFLFNKKALYEVKASGLQLSFNIFL